MRVYGVFGLFLLSSVTVYSAMGMEGGGAGPAGHPAAPQMTEDERRAEKLKLSYIAAQRAAELGVGLQPGDNIPEELKELLRRQPFNMFREFRDTLIRVLLMPEETPITDRVLALDQFLRATNNLLEWDMPTFLRKLARLNGLLRRNRYYQSSIDIVNGLNRIDPAGGHSFFDTAFFTSDFLMSHSDFYNEGGRSCLELLERAIDKVMSDSRVLIGFANAQRAILVEALLRVQDSLATTVRLLSLTPAETAQLTGAPRFAPSHNATVENAPLLLAWYKRVVRRESELLIESRDYVSELIKIIRVTDASGLQMSEAEIQANPERYIAAGGFRLPRMAEPTQEALKRSFVAISFGRVYNVGELLRLHSVLRLDNLSPVRVLDGLLSYSNSLVETLDRGGIGALQIVIAALSRFDPLFQGGRDIEIILQQLLLFLEGRIGIIADAVERGLLDTQRVEIEPRVRLLCTMMHDRLIPAWWQWHGGLAATRPPGHAPLNVENNIHRITGLVDTICRWGNIESWAGWWRRTVQAVGGVPFAATRLAHKN